MTRQIILGGGKPTGVAVFQAQERLKRLRRTTQQAWAAMDVLVTPTAGTIYRLDAVAAEPLQLNANLGY